MTITAGEWRYDPADFTVFADVDFQIYEICKVSGGSLAEIRANGLVIAAVPDLLAALRMHDLLIGHELAPREHTDSIALAELCEAHEWRGEVPLSEFVHQFRKRVLREVTG